MKGGTIEVNGKKYQAVSLSYDDYKNNPCLKCAFFNMNKCNAPQEVLDLGGLLLPDDKINYYGKFPSFIFESL